MTTHRIAVVGGDGIGPEVVAEALKVVHAAGVSLETTDYDLGADRFVRTGEVLPDSVLDELRRTDAILLGAVGPPVGSTSVPPGTLERGLLLRLRFELDLYINLRPFVGSPGRSPPIATSLSCVRTPRAPTPARVGSCAGEHPSRWQRKDRSTPATGWSGACGLPLPWPPAGRPIASPSCTRPTC